MSIISYAGIHDKLNDTPGLHRAASLKWRAYRMIINKYGVGSLHLPSAGKIEHGLQ